MLPLTEPPLGSRVAAWIPFVGSAALIAYALHLALDYPAPAVLAGALALVWTAPAFLARRRMRHLLRSGDADAVLAAWDETLESVPHQETMAPLIRATALAANGHVDRARQALRRAHRGPAWDAAIEQRLVVLTMLEAFEGNSASALDRVNVLRRLPLPSSPMMRSRVSDLRKAFSAFARAFAHCTNRGDFDMLLRVGKSNPLVQWALWYAAAVTAVDRGEPNRAAEILRQAPSWPHDSVFLAFHSEIEREADTPPS
jgi:hypothetical protein